MVGAIVLSPTDAASHKAVVGSPQRVVAWQARGLHLTQPAVSHCLEYLGSCCPDFELEGSAGLVVQFEGVLPETAQCVTYDEPIDLDGQVGIVVDVPSEVFELVRLVLGFDLFPYCRRYFQHAHFIPIVGVGKRGEY